MPIMCPGCGAENPDHAEYCNLCMSTVGFECAEYTGTTSPAFQRLHAATSGEARGRGPLRGKVG
jgi:predicted amidophosphoribosyltransferase